MVLVSRCMKLLNWLWQILVICSIMFICGCFSFVVGMMFSVSRWLLVFQCGCRLRVCSVWFLMMFRWCMVFDDQRLKVSFFGVLFWCLVWQFFSSWLKVLVLVLQVVWVGILLVLKVNRLCLLGICGLWIGLLFGLGVMKCLVRLVSSVFSLLVLVSWWFSLWVCSNCLCRCGLVILVILLLLCRQCCSVWQV